MARLVVLALAMGTGAAVAVPAAQAAPTVESKPLVIALCHGSNQSWPVNFDLEYFEEQFAETSGSSTIADYWRDISQGAFSIDGTLVLDVQLSRNRDEIGDRDDPDFARCRDGVNDQYSIDWEDFAGPVVIKPQTEGRTVGSIDTDDTTLQISAVGPSVLADWAEPPFTLVLTKTGTLWNGEENFENVLVTDIVRDTTTGIATLTIAREQIGYRGNQPPAKAWPANTIVKDISDVYGSQNRTAVVSAHTDPAVLNQELGHFFGFDHSRKLSSADSGYFDCFDVMSTLTCTSHYFTTEFEYPGGTVDQYGGPGMTSDFLDLKGWIPASERAVFGSSSCLQTTYDMRALGLDATGRSGLQQIRVPVTVPIRDGVTSNYLSVELRSKQFHWDSGIPRDAFVFHLRGDDELTYLVDDADAGDVNGLTEGKYFVFGDDTSDPDDDRWFWVSEIDDTLGTGTITVANCPFRTQLDYTGYNGFVYGTRPEVTATFSLQLGGPAPGGSVEFVLGDRSCRDSIPFADQLDGSGVASCRLNVDIEPRAYTFTATWEGIDGVFEPARYVAGVVVAKRATVLDLTPTTPRAYHEPLTLTASLFEADDPDDSFSNGLFGHDVDFTIGEGASAQTCTGTVGSLGSASCTIAQVEQLPQADLPVTASFGGDDNYLPISDDTTIEVTKRATQLEVETPPTTTYHDAVTLSAALFESGGIDPIAGRDLTLAIGAGASAQSCQGTTDASGVVSCDIASVEQVPDPKVSVRAWFDGDLYYGASSGSTTFAVTKRATGLSITAPEFVADEGEIAMSGTLVEAGDAPVAGRDVTFALGVGSERQRCTAATDSSGDAACTISGISQELGPQEVSAAFAGDAYYLPSDADDEVLVFAWTDGGTFVVGDLSASRSPTVTYWSSEWYLDSSLSGGLAPAAFKGFADSPSAPTDCATDWQSRGGGSTDAAEVIPGYTAMLVTDKVVKRGWRLSGSTTAIVVVRVGDGYQSSPGHASTAEILGYLCTD